MVRVNNEEKRVNSLNKSSILCCSISCSCCRYLYRLLPFPLPVYSPSLRSVLTQWGTLSILWQIKIGLWVVYLFMSSFFPQVHGLTFPGRIDALGKPMVCSVPKWLYLQLETILARSLWAYPCLFFDFLKEWNSPYLSHPHINLIDWLIDCLMPENMFYKNYAYYIHVGIKSSIDL